MQILSGITSTKLLDVMANLADLRTPEGYLHVWIFDAADEWEIASAFATEGEPMTPQAIVALIMSNQRFLVGACSVPGRPESRPYPRSQWRAASGPVTVSTPLRWRPERRRIWRHLAAKGKMDEEPRSYRLL